MSSDSFGQHIGDKKFATTGPFTTFLSYLGTLILPTNPPPLLSLPGEGEQRSQERHIKKFSKILEDEMR